MPLSPDQQAEIAEQRRHTQPTLRAVSQGMEDHLYTAYPVPDSSKPKGHPSTSRCRIRNVFAIGAFAPAG